MDVPLPVAQGKGKCVFVFREKEITTMKNPVSRAVAAFLLILGGGLPAVTALADEVAHKVVIQVSTDDERTQKIALNNAVNIQKSLGVDDVRIEIVAYGPGLGIMTLAGKQSQRVADLALQDIVFSACNNTIKKITKKKGAAPKLVEGVSIVDSGAVRIIELQQQGYAYIRP
tara:strand:- start:991 stop:1506 length:516 start_codon:yes stop_codon:yes gene_type:complete